VAGRTLGARPLNSATAFDTRSAQDTLPALQHDPNRPRDTLKADADVDGVSGDDAADTLRYLVAAKPREVVVRKRRGL
jgi:hypothetical protein